MKTFRVEYLDKFGQLKYITVTARNLDDAINTAVEHTMFDVPNVQTVEETGIDFYQVQTVEPGEKV